LDELDEVADLLLLPCMDLETSNNPNNNNIYSNNNNNISVDYDVESNVNSSNDPPNWEQCDQYGFPVESADLPKYREFSVAYVKEQEKMRSRWVKFLQKPQADMLSPVNREELLVLLMKGVPPELRPSVYFRISGARHKRSEAEPNYYVKLKTEAFKRAKDTLWVS
jgi:hypothetical protein